MKESFEGICVLGFPRSGTTLLRRLLDAHPDIAAPGETYLLSATARFFQSHLVVGEVPVGVQSGLTLMGFEPAEIDRRVREMALSFYRDHLYHVGKKIWAEKSATDIFHVDDIDRLFHEQVVYVVIVRHGLDVALSVRDWCRKSEAHPPELLPYIGRYHRPLDAYLHAWVDSSRSIADLRNRRPGRVYLLRYEDLVLDPPSALDRLFRFLRLDWDEQIIARGFEQPPDGFGDWKTYGTSAMEPDRIDSWKKLPMTSISRMARIANQTLTQLGYQAINEAEIPSAEESLRRYQLALRLQASQQAQQKPS